MTADPETIPPPPASRWDAFVWPRWVPVRARLPLIAQITAAFALITAVAMPPFSDVPPSAPPPAVSPEPAEAPPAEPAPVEAPIAEAPPALVAEIPARPAHLNLDVRHSFKNVDLSVTVDGKRRLNTKLTGSGKRFGVFGKRGERGFTRSLELDPGVRVVQVRLRSADDKFDQTRVERFDLFPAAVAAMRVTADESGLFVAADRPPAPDRPVAASLAAAAPRQVQPVVRAAPVRRAARPPSAMAELYQSLRSLLIGVAGFVVSATAGFVVQEFLVSRKKLIGL